MSDSEHSDDAVVIDRDDISNYNPDHILPQDPDVLRKIRAWLGATSYDLPGGEFRKHQASHVSGTGSWLTASGPYRRWVNGDAHGLLWIKGIPGSGKSVMAASLIDHLRERYPRSPVLYFFFRQIIKANHEPRTLLKDWLDQLLEYSPPLQLELKQYEKDKKNVDSFSLEDLTKVLKRAFTALPHEVFCVADALDEMDSGNEAFLQMLGALGQWRPEKAKLLITSRPVPQVEGPLRNTHCLRMRLEEDMVDQDISTFVRSALAQSAIPESEWKIITDAVPGRANGLFLYAKLAMDAFLEPNADVATVLAELPADLNVLYTDLLREHAQRSGVPPSIQHLILQSVTHATRPLRLIELAEMIRVLNPDGVHRDMKATKDLLRAACGPLLEILADETVSVIHHSFTEYLKGTTRAADESGYPLLEYGPTHGDMAVACLRYILETQCLDDVTVLRDDGADEFASYKVRKGQQPEPTSVVSLRLRYPFLDYAARNWDVHLNRFEAEGPQILTNDLLDQFLGNEQRRLAWLHVKHTDERSSKVRDMSPLQAAAKTGAWGYTEKLVQTSTVDATDQHGMTALYYAAAHGHAAVVRALIAAGAAPDQDDTHGGYKPLHKAAKKNHHQVVRALLESGVDPLTPKTREHPGRRCGNAPTTTGETPLMYACHNGHAESVAVFMEYVDSAKTAEQALGWAASHGQSKVVALILKYPGIDVNAVNRGTTPIFLACQVRDSATAKLLLDAGANPHAVTDSLLTSPTSTTSTISTISAGSAVSIGGRRENCVHVLCGPNRGHRSSSQTDSDGDEMKLFELLAAAGVDLHARNHSGRIPLHGAAKASLVLTRLLLDAGSDANAVDENGDTPLHGCTSPEIIAVLMELGDADINARNGKGNTPLMEMTNHYTAAPILKLLEYGPDCNVMNHKGDNPLHLLLRASMAKIEVVEALLAAGADPNARNTEGRTPLLSMSSVSSSGSEFAERLLAHGADVDARDRKGRTLFSRVMGDFRASHSQNPHEDLDFLIKQGASIHTRDFRGRTYLFDAARAEVRDRFSRNSRLAYLIHLGLDTKAVDYEGNGLLHELASDREVHQTYRVADTITVWKKLIDDHQLDLHQQNHAGRTPLHVMCEEAPDSAPRTKDPMPVNLLLERMSGVDDQDYEGFTALHLAAAKSEWMAKLLLDAGANPKLAAHDGTTPLHVAVGAKQGNIVGMLLGRLRSPSGCDGLEAVGGLQAGNWTKRGNTPLELACRSGVPEIFRMLLDAGANMNRGSMFRECSRLEDYTDIWSREEHTGSSFGSPSNDFGPTQAVRLEEILVMVAEHDVKANQSVHPWIGPELAMLANVSANRQHHYTARCFDSFRRSLDPTPELAQNQTNELLPLISGESCASRRTLEDYLEVRPDIDGRTIFKYLLKRREYDLVKILFERGICKLPHERPSYREWNEFVFLISYGFTQLVSQVGPSLAQAAHGQEWHAFGDPSRPGLWHAKRETTQLDKVPKPFLIEALERSVPNMEMVRLIVEKLGVDVNEKFYEQDRMTSENQIVATDSALHRCAKGTAWWRVHQALPYLLQVPNADINLEIRSEQHLTPLQLALSDSGGLWAVDAAKILIAAGADVNAVTGDGSSCLSLARDDAVLTKLLIDHGAVVSPDAIICAANEANPNVLRVLLASGIHPDERRIRPQEVGTPFLGMEAHEVYALHAAGRNLTLSSGRGPFGGSKQPSGAVETVQVLLEHGANPFSKFLLRRDDGRASGSSYNRQGPRRPTVDVPDTHLEATLLHDLISSSFDIRPFLREGLDMEHRNAEGLTILLKICLVNAIAPEVMDTDGYDPESPDDRETILDRMLSLGAKIDSREYFGRNMLHCLLLGESTRYPRGPGMRTLQRILQKAPSLVHDADGTGETPFHYVVRQISSMGGSDTVPGILLEAGADPSVLNNKGQSVLHFLAGNLREKNRTLFKDLLARGLDVNLRDVDGRTPVFGFAHRPTTSSAFGFFKPNGSPSEDPEAGALEMLQASGADFSVRDNKGRTLLHVAAAGSPEHFKALLDLGLDPMLEDDSQQTAIDVASANANVGVLQLFEKPGQAKA